MVATAATTYAFTVSTAAIAGGQYTVVATVTGPAASLPAGSCLKKTLGDVRVPKKGFFKFTVTSAVASGTAQFYAICTPAGQSLMDGQGTTQADVLSST